MANRDVAQAVEVRLYAEDPRTFLPQAGTLERLRLPVGVRVDAGVEEGDEIGTSYDPMIAKLIAYAATRDEARGRESGALADTRAREDDEHAKDAASAAGARLSNVHRCHA